MMNRRILAFRFALIAVLTAPVAVFAQTTKPTGQLAPALQQEAQTAMREAQRLLEMIRSSNLDGPWRGNALARVGRATARLGNTEAARVFARDAVAAANEPTKTPPPAGLAIGGTYTLIAQIFTQLGDTETAVGLGREARPTLDAVSDPAAKAVLEAYLALALIDAGNKDAARDATLQALGAAVKTTQPRDQVSALAMVVLAQARLGDLEQAASTTAALNAAINGLKEDNLDRVIGLAYTARALAATGNPKPALDLAAQAVGLYAKLVASANPPPPAQRVSTLGLIAVAQHEAGDKAAAARALRSADIAAQTVTETYDRFLAMVTVVDTVLQVAH